jgi:hypothetical protein
MKSSHWCLAGIVIVFAFVLFLFRYEYVVKKINTGGIPNANQPNVEYEIIIRINRLTSNMCIYEGGYQLVKGRDLEHPLWFMYPPAKTTGIRPCIYYE